MKTPETAATRWTRIIAQQQCSGSSVAEFCRRRDLSQPSFFVWRRRLQGSRGGAAGPPTSPPFVEVKIARQECQGAGSGPDVSALELRLPQGRSVLVRQGFDRQVLRQLLAVLEEPA